MDVTPRYAGRTVGFAGNTASIANSSGRNRNEAGGCYYRSGNSRWAAVRDVMRPLRLHRRLGEQAKSSFLPFRIVPMNGTEARESSFRLKASVAPGAGVSHAPIPNPLATSVSSNPVKRAGEDKDENFSRWVIRLKNPFKQSCLADFGGPFGPLSADCGLRSRTRGSSFLCRHLTIRPTEARPRSRCDMFAIRRLRGKTPKMTVTKISILRAGLHHGSSR